MPRVVKHTVSGTAVEAEGVKVTVTVTDARRGKVRVVIDLPPGDSPPPKPRRVLEARPAVN